MEEYPPSVVRHTERTRKSLQHICRFGRSEALCVIENPESELGQGACYMYSGVEADDLYLVTRRLLNELKVRLKERGVNFSYTLTRAPQKESGFYKPKEGGK